jgi:deazaflavin-dependent oxidoreductase (nitroreductase family)
MHTDDASLYRFRSLGWRAGNAVVGVLARAGIGPIYLLSTHGWRSGRLHTVPVVPVEHAGKWWLVAPYGPVSWVHNARRAERVRLRRGRQSHEYAVREVGAEEAAPVLKRYVGIATRTRACFQGGENSPIEDFIAEAEGHPVFELILLSDAPPQPGKMDDVGVSLAREDRHGVLFGRRSRRR